MRDNNNSLAERTQALVLGFALGDALGSPFEFATPNEDDTRRSFYETEKLEFTDDTMLVLSTLHAYEKSRHLPDYPANVNFWGEMHQHTCFWLVDWLESGDLRGMGNTSLAAIKQMRRHAEEHGTFESFGIMSRGYNADMSSGNGILSRALPLLALGIAHDPAFSRWLNLTHLHADGHLAVEDLWRWLISEEAPAFRFSETAPGFYAPETLEIAIQAMNLAKSAYECFCYSQRPEGDNDSTAALSLGLWGWKHGLDSDLQRLVECLAARDRETLFRYLKFDA